MNEEKMMVEISNESADDIFRNVLMADYKRTLEEVEGMKAKLDNLDDYQQENYKHDKKLLKAMKTMIKYYFPEHAWKDLF